MNRKFWLHVLFVLLFALALWCTPSDAASPTVVVWPVKANAINLKSMHPNAKVKAITKGITWRTFLHRDKKLLAVYMAEFKVAIFKVNGVELRAVVRPQVSGTSNAPSLSDINHRNLPSEAGVIDAVAVGTECLADGNAYRTSQAAR